MTVEHMLPRSKGGTDDPANLARACKPCNSRKGAKVGRWLACGRASWVGDYCIDPRCIDCAPAQAAQAALTRALREAGIMRRWHIRKRNRLIADAVAAGGSLRDVARAVGLSHTAVNFIANGRPER